LHFVAEDLGQLKYEVENMMNDGASKDMQSQTDNELRQQI